MATPRPQPWMAGDWLYPDYEHTRHSPGHTSPHVRKADANPAPRSNDPSFYKHEWNYGHSDAFNYRLATVDDVIKLIDGQMGDLKLATERLEHLRIALNELRMIEKGTDHA